jgi:hypothetical protein
LSPPTIRRAPPLDASGYTVLESIVAAKVLLARGVPAARIWAETASLDTSGNAYFARVIHTDPAGLLSRAKMARAAAAAVRPAAPRPPPAPTRKLGPRQMHALQSLLGRMDALRDSIGKLPAGAFRLRPLCPRPRPLGQVRGGAGRAAGGAGLG